MLQSMLRLLLRNKLTLLLRPIKKPKMPKLKLMLLLPNQHKLPFRIMNLKLRLSPRKTPLIAPNPKPTTKPQKKKFKREFLKTYKFTKLP